MARNRSISAGTSSVPPRVCSSQRVDRSSSRCTSLRSAFRAAVGTTPPWESMRPHRSGRSNTPQVTVKARAISAGAAPDSSAARMA